MTIEIFRAKTNRRFLRVLQLFGNVACCIGVFDDHLKVFHGFN